MVTSVRDHNMYLQNESTGESNECICSPSSLLSAEQMKTIGAHASGGCSPPSATIPSALPLTSSLGLDSGAGCCTVWTLTRGAGKHVTLSWLDTSEKHWCWKIYALAWILTFYSVVYIVPIWPRGNTFTRISRFSWASRSRSTGGNPPSSGKFAFWMKHTIPFRYLFLTSQQIVHTDGYIQVCWAEEGREENTLPVATLNTLLNYSPGWRNLWMAFGRSLCGTRDPLTWLTIRKYTVKEKRRQRPPLHRADPSEKNPDLVTLGSSRERTAYQVLSKQSSPKDSSLATSAPSCLSLRPVIWADSLQSRSNCAWVSFINFIYSSALPGWNCTFKFHRWNLLLRKKCHKCIK